MSRIIKSMKRFAGVVMGAAALLTMMILYPGTSSAGVNLSVTIPLPGLVFTAPPAMVAIPGTYAYFAPDVEADIFFYHGYWYRPYGGRWYVSAGFNGPWGYIGVNRVPHALIDLPPSYRRVPPGYERVPYGMVSRNWQTWERERYWDNHGGRGEYARPHRGHGMAMGMGRGRGRGGDD